MNTLMMTSEAYEQRLREYPTTDKEKAKIAFHMDMRMTRGIAAIYVFHKNGRGGRLVFYTGPENLRASIRGDR